MTRPDATARGPLTGAAVPDALAFIRVAPAHGAPRMRDTGPVTWAGILAAVAAGDTITLSAADHSHTGPLPCPRCGVPALPSRAAGR